MASFGFGALAAALKGAYTRRRISTVSSDITPAVSAREGEGRKCTPRSRKPPGYGVAKKTTHGSPGIVPEVGATGARNPGFRRGKVDNDAALRYLRPTYADRAAT